MKVLFVDTVHPILNERLTSAGFDCVDGTNWNQEQIEAEISQYHGLVIRSRFPVDQEFIEKATSLRFIARSGSGMENIAVSAAEHNGISLYNAPEGNKTAVAEHALGMLLALLNQIIQGDDQVRRGIWDREGNRGIELAGKTVGIIGFGHNGSAFAKSLSGMGCRILAYDKYLDNYAPDHVEEVEMTEILNEADILSLHIPLTEETHYLVDEQFIQSMRKPFFLINTSRGKIASTREIVKALNAGKIRGACLDVLDIEKASFELDSSASQVLENLGKRHDVILSPHVAGWTVESYEKLSNVLADKILSEFKA